MLVIVFINKSIATRVIRRININTFHLRAVTRLQKIKGLEIVGMNEQTVGLFVKIGLV